MNILSWLERLLSRFLSLLHFKREKPKDILSSQLSSYLDRPMTPFTGPESFTTETEVLDLLKEVSKLKEDITQELNTFEQAIKDIKDLKKDAEEAVKTSKKTQSLVIFGFFALALVVIGIAFGYWEYVFDSARKDDYKFNLSEKINNQNQEIIKLQGENKKIMDIVNCQRDKKYWQYEECFK